MKNNDKKYRKKFYNPDTDIENSVVSTTECTGLTYITPDDNNEADSYTEIYNVPVTPKKDDKK